MSDIVFSIIIVSLNPGKRLGKTLDSLRAQTFKDFEIIIKDGCSYDESLTIPDSYQDLNIRHIIKKDKGIYDAMNEAVSYAKGRYIYFLNCGDTLASSGILKEVSEVISQSSPGERTVIYGNIYEEKTKKVVMSNPKMDAFGCYRNVPCHQACFFESSLVREHPFRTELKVRADYEQFLYIFFKSDASLRYLDTVIASYEGGGYSEKNAKISSSEHALVTKEYFSALNIIKYKTILALTLAPVRTALANGRITSGIYNSIKRMIYKGRKG